MQVRSASDRLTLDRDQVERFRRDCVALTGAAPSPDNVLALAVSGGPDSLALLLLGHAAFPGSVIAATVDHGLRPEAAEEAALVRRLCNQLDVPHETLAGTVPAAGNLQQGARALRYALLADWAMGRAAWVATAHQQDDVAETFLMRARRGAGAGGLAAMAAARPLGPIQLIRPLLGWTRAELEVLVEGAGIAPVRDPSNQDPRFDRARIRALLAEAGDLPADRLAAAARNLRDAEDALAWIAEREWQGRAVVAGGTVALDPAGLPRELRRRLAERAVATVREAHGLSPDWRETGLEPLLAALDSGGTGTLAEVIGRTKAAIWRFELAPPRRSH
ncbi:tRNA(Ile)-lysidine synthase [Sphingomonas kyeonggiensis]|uniref:tRNA(Ile)-lysidine synthase n=1 Tax=Sphingomonas kyeonggiensis TaxID=1268553 RepID=A0A7W7JZ80_9SPHN|nr:tRNA lysidine(34) synthetase TilS [Sphingomonas kyeonggiensis]MBB4838079.1 tRNA(Ile)-lysidine synthase [Sphingomonas kyeonggiensis]